jgi:hypothetical protein
MRINVISCTQKYAFPCTDFHATYEFSAAAAALSADLYIEIHRSTVNVDSNG